MAKPQDDFLAEWKAAFHHTAGEVLSWNSGQGAANTAALPGVRELRRGQQLRPGEAFELGDLRGTYRGCTIIVEYDSGQPALSNLLKYWPWARGELSKKPGAPIALIHFTDWWSYGSYRDLWQWTLTAMQNDPRLIIPVEGRQFDHGGKDQRPRAESIRSSVEWVMATVSKTG